MNPFDCCSTDDFALSGLFSRFLIDCVRLRAPFEHALLFSLFVDFAKFCCVMYDDKSCDDSFFRTFDVPKMFFVDSFLASCC